MSTIYLGSLICVPFLYILLEIEYVVTERIIGGVQIRTYLATA